MTTGTTGAADEQRLRKEIARLAPWHHKVQITAAVSTEASGAREAGADAATISFMDAAQHFGGLIEDIFPDGLAGRSVLDCACNCGAYLFWAKERGAGSGFGFDARAAWIEQARFLAAHREFPSDGLTFEVHELHDLPALGLGLFDVTLFFGILYHLPDPVTGLQIAADLTREILIVNTATRTGLADGMLALARENPAHPLSGVDGLHWFPTGPGVVQAMLESMGFLETCCVWNTDDTANQPPGIGRLIMVAARQQGRLNGLKEAFA